MLRFRLALAALPLLLVPVAPGASAAVPVPVSVALPSVEQLSGGVHGRPFMGLLAVPSGFVQEEYLVSGTAHAHYGLSVFAQRPVQGTSSLPPLPYATRVVVVRPTKRSNGTALVTWANVTFGHDIGEWFNVGRQVTADGYTYVEASVQLASAPALKAFDPVRYARVALPGDAYSYDIYSQVAKALRHGFGRVPGHPHVLAMGASQSGFALDQYLEAVQPLYERVYDGFFVKVANGPDHHNDRPVIRLLSEDEIDGSSRSPDGVTYRQWEIAGTSHGNKDDFEYIAATERRDLGVDLVNPLAGDNAPFGTSSCQMNRFPAAAGHNAALVALRRWAVDRVAPAKQPREKVVGGTIVRDAGRERRWVASACRRCRSLLPPTTALATASPSTGARKRSPRPGCASSTRLTRPTSPRSLRRPSGPCRPASSPPGTPRRSSPRHGWHECRRASGTMAPCAPSLPWPVLPW